MSADPALGLHHVTTLPDAEEVQEAASQAVVTLTILAHPNPSRIGDRSPLTSLLTGKPQALSRLEPDFSPPQGGGPEPLGHYHLSRTPISLRVDPGSGVVIDPADSPTDLRVDGELVAERLVVPASRLDRGVVLLLGHRVALLLHVLFPAQGRPPDFGLIGDSGAMLEMRRHIERLAPRDHTVLLRGETGTGKELVARALHVAGPRRDGPFCAINLSAVPANLAASELFGAARGAYTGAGPGHQGYFQRAHGGTLFLDEVGAANLETQTALLRTLENGEIQSVGAAGWQRVDVRVIAATDADLEAAAEAETFRAPLLHRLSAHPIHLPALRQRRDDLGRLLVHFLRRELEVEKRLDLLADVAPDARSWLSPELVARLALYAWPGNVRELRNIASQLVLHNLDVAEMKVPHHLEMLLQETPLGSLEPTIPTPSPKWFAHVPYRDVHELGREECERALGRNDYEPSRAASELGVARGSFYKRLKSLGLSTAAALEAGAIQAAHRDFNGDTKRMARSLKVSEHGLKMRLNRLGLR